MPLSYGNKYKQVACESYITQISKASAFSVKSIDLISVPKRQIPASNLSYKL